MYSILALNGIQFKKGSPLRLIYTNRNGKCRYELHIKHGHFTRNKLNLPIAMYSIIALQSELL